MKNWAKNRSLPFAVVKRLPDVNGQRLLVRAWDGVKDFDGGALAGFPFPWRRPWERPWRQASVEWLVVLVLQGSAERVPGEKSHRVLPRSP